MENFETTGSRQSRIPHLTAPVAPILHEMTESQHNTRSQSAMRASAATGVKRPGADIHRFSGIKRPTLAERAADFSEKTGRAVGTSRATGMTGMSMVDISSQNTKRANVPLGNLTHALPSTSSRLPPTSNHFDRGAGASSVNQSTFKQQGIMRHRQTTRLRPATSMGRYGKDNCDGELSANESIRHNVLDVEERLLEVESEFSSLKEAMSQSLVDRNSLEERAKLAATRENDLVRQRDLLEQKILSMQAELDTCRQQLLDATLSLERERRENSYMLEDKAREQRRELDDLRRGLKEEAEILRQSHKETLEAMERHCRTEQDAERDRMLLQMEDIKARLTSEQQSLHLELQERGRELQQSRSALSGVQGDLDHERSLREALQIRFAKASAENLELEEKVRTLQAQADFLKSDSRQQSDQFAEMEARMQHALRVASDAQQKLIREETERRILFNKYQELKGNIRVMCRVRPASDNTNDGDPRITFPDAKTSSSKIDVVGPEEKNSLGAVSRKTNSFEFDRVFAPGVRNDEIFDEISQLVQSALDGYNVCIFCYGQTGSGKTYTMSSPDGMIPRATHMIYDTIRRLEEKSWSYTMEGSFVEVYNEELHDLLANPSGGRESEAKKKPEIRHDEARKATTVLNCQKVRLDSSEEVELILQRAQSNRSVAATKANERSSRSHSVFILQLVGENAATGERCEGTLNLVDLAGSERLKHSGVEGDRRKETQNINRSLACLGDVIEALGRGAPHVPYRNSKLTHLLQYSLGGNSKTLMFVMVSPLEEHLKESLTSLRFATKVHNTHIGTAKSTRKMRD